MSKSEANITQIKTILQNKIIMNNQSQINICAKQAVFQNPKQDVDFRVLPELAEHWLNTCKYEHQRDIRQYHVTSLSRMMEDGIFRQKTQINFMKLNGQYFLTNGQHTLSAIVKSKIPTRLCIIVSDANTWKDVADDFSRHDTHLTRRLSDSLVAHEMDKKLCVGKNQLQVITAGCMQYKFMLGEFKSRSASQSTHDEKLLILNEHGELGKLVLIKFFEGCETKNYIRRKTTIATAMATTAINEEASFDFWRTMALNDGLRVGDPRKTLIEWFQARMTHSGTQRLGNDAKKATTDYEFIKGIATAWNAWIEGRELKLIKLLNYDEKTVTFKKIGTFYGK